MTQHDIMSKQLEESHPLESAARQISQRAFLDAVRSGVLSLDHRADNCVSHYMYMGGNQFKHIVTRQYVKGF